MFGKFSLIALLTLGGCDLQSMNIEAINKAEYSVLQHYELEYRGVNHIKPYMIFRHALDTNLTVLAFPVKNRPTGYVVILAQAEGMPKVKAMTDVDFEVTKDVYASVKMEVALSTEVDQFIAARVK